MIKGNFNELLQFDKTGKTTLHKDERFHAMLVTMPEGEELKPHFSKTDAFCIVQKGEAEFILAGESFHIKKGDFFTFKAMQMHSVKAITDFSLLLIK